jgi:hypothetical protein
MGSFYPYFANFFRLLFSLSLSLSSSTLIFSVELAYSYNFNKATLPAYLCPLLGEIGSSKLSTLSRSSLLSSELDIKDLARDFLMLSVPSLEDRPYGIGLLSAAKI